MPPPGDPEVRESATVPGAWDVRGADGVVRPVAPSVARRMGYSLPEPAAQPQPSGGSFLQGTNTGTVPAPAEDGGPAPMTPAQAAAQAEFDAEAARIRRDPESQQGPGTEYVRPETMGLAPVDPSDLRTSPAQREAMEQRDAQRAQQQAEAERTQELRQLVTGAAQLDPMSVSRLRDLSRAGDERATEALRELARRQDAGLLRPRGGGGGARQSVTQSDTRRFSGPAREMSPEEAQRMQQLQRDFDDIERERMIGLAEEVDAEVTAQERTAAAINRAQQRIAAMEERNAQEQRLRQAELQRRQDQLDDLARQAAESRLQPGRLLAKGQTGSRISAALGIALGALGDAWSGGDGGLQTALGIINTAIDRDIDAQKQTLLGKRQDVATAQSLMGQARARFGDEQAAEAAAKNAILAGVQRQIEALGRTAQGQTAQARMRQMLANIEAQRNQLRQQAMQSGLGTRELVITEEQGTRRGGGGGRSNIDIGELVGEEQAVTPGERELLAVKERGARETIELADGALEMIDNTNLTGVLMGEAPAATADARRLERELRKLSLPLTAAAFGAATPDQVQFIQDTYGLTREISADEIREVVQSIRDRAEKELQAAQLSVSPAAVQENRSRASDVQRRVSMEDGRAGSVARTFEPTRGGR